MFFIVMGHLIGQGGGTNVEGFWPFSIILYSGSRIAVNLFLMLGIWFMVDYEFKASRILKIYGTTWFYTAVITSLMVVIGGVNITAEDLAGAFMPFLRKTLWFSSLYICLLLLAPFLHKFQVLWIHIWTIFSGLDLCISLLVITKSIYIKVPDGGGAISFSVFPVI